jgi:Mg2+ and Co2+ transporter CorA
MTSDRERAVIYQQLLWPKRDIVTYLIQRDYLQSGKTEMNATYFRDVYDLIISMISQLEVVNEVVVALQNTYLSKIDLHVSEVSNNMGDFVKRLTSFSTIMLPLSLITGLLGMNVYVPFATYNSEWAETTAPFWTLMALMAAYAIVSAYILHRNNLL